MKRGEILDTAKEYVCKDRNEQYSEPENNFQNIANLWNSYLIAKCGVCIPKLEAVDVGIMMTLLKVARMASGNKEDNFIDAAGYIACVGEIATEEADKKLTEDAMRKVADGLSTRAEKESELKGKDDPLSIYYDGEKSYIQPNTEEREKFWADTCGVEYVSPEIDNPLTKTGKGYIVTMCKP